MIISRHILFPVLALSVFCLYAIAPPVAAQTQNTVPQNPAHDAIPSVTGTTDAPDTTIMDTPPRPMPKRLTPQERWNRMSPEQRSVIVNEWLELDETVRPVFPVYRDNALEQQNRQTAPQDVPQTVPPDTTLDTPLTTSN